MAKKTTQKASPKATKTAPIMKAPEKAKKAQVAKVAVAKVAKSVTKKPARGATHQSPTKQTSKPQPQVVITLTHDQIANRAHEIWLAKGRPIGHDQTIWGQAESELKIGM